MRSTVVTECADLASLAGSETAPNADSVRKNVSAPLCVRSLQIIRFGVPLLEAWHRVTVMPGRKRERSVEPSPVKATAADAEGCRVIRRLMCDACPPADVRHMV